MKKIILTILTTITIWGINAQGNNLEFNQVIDLTFNVSTATRLSTITSAFTIPTGKVWKITKAGGITAYGNGISNMESFYKKNTAQYFSSLTDNSDTQLTIWLASGTYDLKADFDGFFNSSLADPASISLNGLEFNIVP
jgi:hypothetical protein